MKLEDFRKEFPQLEQKVYGKPLVYLDNAASSLRPRSVIEKWREMSEIKNANIYRANHFTAVQATSEVESARETVRAFLNAAEPGEIIFTSGDTAALNLLASSFGESFIKEGDEVLLSEAEHHSVIVPWQMLCQRKGAVIRVLPVDDRGELVLDRLPELLGERTKIVCVTHVSNVLGIFNPIEEIIRQAHSRGIPVAIDGAQGIVHSEVDVQALDCDFYAFSGHKIYAAPGTGVLYGKRRWLEKMVPWQGGGEMISSVKWSGTTYADIPFRFEAGTPNFAGIPTFVPAVGTALEVRKERRFQEDRIVEYVSSAFREDRRIRMFGAADGNSRKIPLFSFTVEGAHHEDLSILLDKMGIAVRSGQLCAEPLMDRYGVTGMLRASFGAYNTLQEAEYFIKGLQRAVKMLEQ